MAIATDDQTPAPIFVDAEHTDEVSAKAASGALVLDTIDEQLAELAETRRADRKLDERERAHEVERILGGKTATTYGTWVHFPWSNRLVHLLPEAEFFELRTSRNRNKITASEQKKLAGLTLGVAGLSVGQATALTLALEGIGGTLRLADFDRLSLSNMNRLRSGVHEIGLRKTTIVARGIYELNPYAKLELFEDGITDANIARFVDGLDMLFEECDDLKMKVRLREEARRRKIAVLMETSDRGMIDVERFDLEPDRQLFHGLAGDLDASKLDGLSTYEKVPIVLAIVGTKTMSRRAAASMIDIDMTLKTWPQLGSAVALGGAINTDVARRIFLGKIHSSGRFFVDTEDVVRDPTPTLTTPAPPPIASVSPPLPRRASAQRTKSSIADDLVERLVRSAMLAPSGGNCQPWKFHFEGDTLTCIHDEARSRTLLDFDHRATYVAFGALAENLRLAAAGLGLGIELSFFPDPSDSHAIVRARLGGPPAELSGEDRRLLDQIELRVTNRKLSKREPLSESARVDLLGVAARSGADLRFLTEDGDLATIGDILGWADRLRIMSPQMHREMMGEVRWSKADAARTRDGLELDTLELTATDEAGMRLVSDWSVMEVVREVDGGHGLMKGTHKSIAAASAVGLLTVGRSDHSELRHAYLSGGSAMQRVWLAATALGYAWQPMTAMIYLFARLEDGGGAGLDEREKVELAALRERHRRLFDLDATPRAEIMLFRLSVADPPTARSLRRNVGDVLEFG